MGLTRREALIGVGAVAATGIGAVIFARRGEPAPLTGVDAGTTGDANPQNQNKPKLETAKPPELSAQARNIVLDKWLSILNSSQKKRDDFSGNFPPQDTFLDMNTKNMEDWKKRNLAGVFSNQGSPGGDPLVVSWVSGRVSQKSGGFDAWKYTGEMEIKEVRIVTTDQRGTGKPDDNGFQWSGEFRLDLRVKSHSFNYFFNGLSTNEAALRAFVASAETRQYPPFTDWSGESLTAKLALKNGTWNWDKDPFKEGQFDNFGELGSSGISLPTRVLYPAFKCTAPGTSCVTMSAFK